ncbi:Hypothetical predicted protein, partial [Mytilus galloprovincialis]
MILTKTQKDFFHSESVKRSFSARLIFHVALAGLSQLYPPQFDTFPFLVQYSEGCSTTKVLATLTARGSNGFITISANDDSTRARVQIIQTSSGTSGGFFTTVQIRQKACMDRETIGTLQIYILDVNDEPPSFTSKLFQITVPEDTQRSTEVLQVHASDPDNGVGGVVRYSLQDGGGLNGTATLIIKVLDIQNKPPYFTGQPFKAHILEESPIGTIVNFVFPIRADDGDTGVPHDIQYKFTTGACIEFFEIKQNGSFGIVQVKKRIDRDSCVLYEVGGICTLTLMALEMANSTGLNLGPTNTTTSIEIIVIDINDNLPMFRPSMYNATVFENMMQVSIAIEGSRIEVTDEDQDDNGRLDLELQYINGTKVQGIKPVPDKIQGNGYIMLYLQDSFTFDYEEVQGEVYKLVASEEQAPMSKTHCLIYLKIIDRNDNLPQFSKWSYAVDILENVTSSQMILTETATDKDSGEFSKMTYSLQDGKDIFTIDNVTGEITKRENVVLDYEKRDEYVLTLVAKDGGGSLQSAEVVVRLHDINDNPPVFSQSSYIGSIEGSDPNFEITVTASDRDKQNTTNSQIGFSLIDSPLNMHNNFTITTTWKNEESMGKISLRNSLVYEKLNKTTIELYVRAIDFGNPSLSATSTVIIHIQACSSLSSNCPCGKSLKTRVTSPTHESTDKYHPMHSIAGIKHFVFRYDPDSHVMVAITQKKCYLYIMSVTDSDDVQVTDGLRRLK